MKLINLIDYLVNSERLEELYIENQLNKNSETILIYMHQQIDLESDLEFYTIEECLDEMLFEKDGIKYIQLFPIEHAIYLIENDLDLKNKGLSHLEIASRLLEYRINDA